MRLREIFRLRRRAAKFRSRSTELAACCRPSSREIQLAAVGHRSQQEAQRRGLVSLRQQVAQGVEIAERLGHLLGIDQQVLGVQPVAHERLAGGGFGLRDLVFVVREDQVHAAGVDVERFAEIFHGHGRSTRCASRDGPGRCDVSQKNSPGLGAFQSAKSRASALS